MPATSGPQPVGSLWGTRGRRCRAMLGSAGRRAGRWGVRPGGPARPRSCTPGADCSLFLSGKNKGLHCSSTPPYRE